MRWYVAEPCCVCRVEADVLGLNVGQYGKCILKRQAKDRHINCFTQGSR